MQNMIKKLYPGYNEASDWVIWLIPDFYYNHAFIHLSGEIKVRKTDGSVSIIAGTVWNPYANKDIHQLSFVPKDNNGCIHGIPLVYSSFEEIMEIAEINIKWKLFEFDYSTDNIPVTLHYSSSEMDYEISFEKNPKDLDARFFIIHSKDYPASTYIEECPEEWIEIYMCNFDFAASSDATIELTGDEFKVFVEGSEYYKDSAVPNKNFSNTLQKYICLIQTLTDEEIQMIKVFADKTVCKEKTQYHPAYRKKKETIRAVKASESILR